MLTCVLYLSVQKPGNLFPINDLWRGICIGSYCILQRHLFTLEHLTPVFIQAQVYIWSLLLFKYSYLVYVASYSSQDFMMMFSEDNPLISLI